MKYKLMMMEAIWIEIDLLQQYRFKPNIHYAVNAHPKLFPKMFVFCKIKALALQHSERGH